MITYNLCSTTPCKNTMFIILKIFLVRKTYSSTTESRNFVTSTQSLRRDKNPVIVSSIQWDGLKKSLNITKLVIKIKWAFPETVRTLIYPPVEDIHFQKLYRFWNSIKTFTTNPGIFQYFFSFFHSWNFFPSTHWNFQKPNLPGIPSSSTGGYGLFMGSNVKNWMNLEISLVSYILR